MKNKISHAEVKEFFDRRLVAGSAYYIALYGFTPWGQLIHKTSTGYYVCRGTQGYKNKASLCRHGIYDYRFDPTSSR